MSVPSTLDVPPSLINNPLAVCTLWENDFHKGAGAFINSLARSGFSGKVWNGYRGVLPPWAAGAKKISGEIDVLVVGSIEIMFVRLETTMHFSQYKALFMIDVLERLDPNAAGLYYFDPDVMLLGTWQFFEEWLDYGIALCEDGSYPMNPTHPLVRGWQRYASTLGYSEWRFVGAYLNTGIVGLRRANLGFRHLWTDLMDSVRRDFKLSENLKTAGRADLFYASDQDVLNMAFCVSNYPISYMGMDAMAFDFGEWLTIHAYSPKPWRRRVFRDWLIEGHKPDSALRQYWALVSAPLTVEPVGLARAHNQWMIPLAALLARFYKRGI
jgi:hypothetical protein